MDKGWIKLHRSLLDWEWYDDINTMRLFVHLILKANHKPKKYKGKNVGAGQVITGRKLLSNETGLTEQQIRTCIKKLKSTNELTVKADGKGSVIQLVNYRKYQQPTRKTTSDQPTDNQPSTNHQPTINQQITTNKKENNVKNEKELCDLPCDFKKELLDYINYLIIEYKRSIGHMQIEQILKMLGSWYKNTEDKKKCLSLNMANGWKTLNWVDVAKNETPKTEAPYYGKEL